MNLTDIPARIFKAFGINGLRNNIPVDSSTTTDNTGAATFDKGFPAITMKALSAGGIPPSGKDVNGTLFAVTQQQQWQNAGGAFPFDSTFSTSIGGYPAGAVIPSSDFYGFWQNTLDANSTNPENLTGTLTGWVPRSFYGSSSAAVTTANVTLSTLQAARDEIVLSGALTGNRYVYLPAWQKEWRIVNNCTGNFWVLVSTQGGSLSVQSTPGSVINVRCDGANIYQVQNSLLLETGYQKLDSGLIMQWGVIVVIPGTTITVNYPIPFQVGPFIALASKGSIISTKDYSCGIDASKTFATIINGENVAGGTTGQGIRWFVLGY